MKRQKQIDTALIHCTVLSDKPFKVHFRQGSNECRIPLAQVHRLDRVSDKRSDGSYHATLEIPEWKADELGLEYAP